MTYKITRPDGVVEYRKDTLAELPNGAIALTEEQYLLELSQLSNIL